MLQSLLATGNVPLLKQVGRFAERRQEVLAGNIANVDTPGYRMRDLPTDAFQQALERAVAQLRQPHLAATQGQLSLHPPTTPTSLPQAIEDLFPDSLFQALEPSAQSGITFQDANNRSVEHQFLQMTKNSILQNFALRVLQGQYDQLQTAISEKV